MIVESLHTIVKQNPGHTSAAFIKTLTELYLSASTDTVTMYREDPAENEAIFDSLRERIADVLKLTPRRRQVSSAQVSSAEAQEAEKLVSQVQHDAGGPDASVQETKEHEAEPLAAEAAMTEQREPDDQGPEEEHPDDQETTRRVLSRDAEITADIDLGDLLPEESVDGLHFGKEAADESALPASAEPPPPIARSAGRRGKRAHSPESDA
jgi:hypothetical protein